MSATERPMLGEREVHVWSFSLGDPPRGRRRQAAREQRAAILASYLGVAASEVALVETETGKPALADRSLEFNLSHSGTLAVLAVSRSLPVGVDLEVRRDSIDLTKGIRDRCTEREGRHVLAAADPHDEWVRLWTRKEAVVKADGTGVLDQLADVDVLEEQVRCVDGAVDGSWRCLDLDPPASGFHLALAVPDVPDVLVIQRR